MGMCSGSLEAGLVRAGVRFVTRHELRPCVCRPGQLRMGQHMVTRRRSVLTLYSVPPPGVTCNLVTWKVHAPFVIITHRTLFLSLGICPLFPPFWFQSSAPLGFWVWEHLAPAARSLTHGVAAISPRSFASSAPWRSSLALSQSHAHVPGSLSDARRGCHISQPACVHLCGPPPPLSPPCGVTCATRALPLRPAVWHV